MAIWTDPELSKSSMVKTLHLWWTANRGASGIPDRDSFDVFAHTSLLPNLLVSDVETEPFRIRFRLVGTRVVHNLGVDFTGQYLDELTGPEYETPWTDYFHQSYKDRRPIMGALTEPTTSGNTFTYEFAIFPVARGGADVKQFISLEYYFDFTLTSGVLVGL